MISYETITLPWTFSQTLNLNLKIRTTGSIHRKQKRIKITSLGKGIWKYLLNNLERGCMGALYNHLGNQQSCKNHLWEHHWYWYCACNNQQCSYSIPHVQTILSETLVGGHNSHHKFLGVLGRDTSLPGLGESVSVESSPSSAEPWLISAWGRSGDPDWANTPSEKLHSTWSLQRYL